ncbi:hypothetical protein GKZ90_0002365 [Flavobacterium sp. MC2016-06]|jgi:hypothetical protein|uniref:hypothetical protein n=1 Tax=Flavobacterium sp. MC2016-06 TaxID=2676308 RepID=UPI0012BA7B21|nr:hypothetical protein [Flavobacterium sp. MC2016-06]MBU3858278.1 hypothetical protein [Flavobacterium sp. MC2016-06]
MNKAKRPFLDTIYHLRTIEQVILYNKLMTISKEEEKETISFLETQYERETLDYPCQAPKFSATAAFWGAKTVYSAAQLLLYREHKIEELDVFLPPYNGEINASVILSADLCLRFLPQVVMEMKRIDAEDAAIVILEKHLEYFHYAAIGFDVVSENINLEVVFSDPCFKQLYLNRVVERKAKKTAEIETVKGALMAGFGDYKQVFWKEL